MIFQQRHALTGEPEVEQTGPDVAARLPGRGRDVPSRGFGHVLRASDATTPFARRFDGDIGAEKRNPRRQSVRCAEVVSGRQNQRRVGTAARGFDSGLRDGPLRAGNLEARVIEKCNERESFKVPRFKRPDIQFMVEIGFEEFFQTGVIEPPGVQFGGGVRRRKRPRIEARAAGAQ